jgi:hypothetical protein
MIPPMMNHLTYAYEYIDRCIPLTYKNSILISILRVHILWDLGDRGYDGRLHGRFLCSTRYHCYKSELEVVGRKAGEDIHCSCCLNSYCWNPMQCPFLSLNTDGGAPAACPDPWQSTLLSFGLTRLWCRLMSNRESVLLHGKL